jgi:hypothetical protein
MPRILRDELEHASGDLVRVFDRIYEESLRIWDEQHLYEFTDHGKRHTQQVERNLDALTRPLQRSAPLSGEEIFVLLSACCLHDIGMQRADDPEARSRHAQSAYDLILNSHARSKSEVRRVTLPIDDRNARVAIATVARAHWTQYALELPQQDFINDQNVEGRLRLLGLLLAMADLLDLSPVRARYFRSIHRLYDLSSESTLHQTMHDLVKGFRLGPPQPNIPGALQFRIDWAHDNEEMHMISDWVMHWFSSQWLQLQHELYEASAGSIHWTRPWAKPNFNPPQGQISELSTDASRVLKAERAEQLRINRDDFTNRFLQAIKNKETILFLFPAESDFDWHRLSEWCEAHAHLEENCCVARVNVRPSYPSYSSGIIAQIMEQWDKRIPECSDDEAEKHLEIFITQHTGLNLVSIIRTDEYGCKSFENVLKSLVVCNDEAQAARVCLLICPDAAVPSAVTDASIVQSGGPLGRSEVEQHLQNQRGYSSQESRAFYDRMLKLGLTEYPARIYTYIEDHCVQS